LITVFVSAELLECVQFQPVL